MANCQIDYPGITCDAVATTTLTKNNGVIVPLCELHAQFLIKFFRAVQAGVIKTTRERAQDEASHWFVKNKIPA